jgi:hypothetical protein
MRVRAGRRIGQMGIEISPRQPILQAARGSALMAFRANYRFQRTERDRTKQAKKEEKLKKRQERDAAPQAANTPEHPDSQAQSDE